MTKQEAEDFVYKSYLKAEKYQDYNLKDSEKRRPDLTKDIIREKKGTPCVVVTGSKGKGSVSNMVSQILQSQYKVGLMTSPHLVDFCERFKINGNNISDNEFIEYMTEIQPEIDAIDTSIPPNICVSPMGIQADLALTFFNAKNTDFNIFECGKGVKFDDVNNVMHNYAIINSIFLEHTRELGNTLEAIASDKAHVITGEQQCVYVAEQQVGVINVIKKRALELNVPVKIYGEDFWAENIHYSNTGMIFDVVIGVNRYESMSIPLLGEHQAKNCALAMAFCADILDNIEIDLIRQKLMEIDWPGRMEILSSKPFIILDACINSASCKNVKDVMKQLNIYKATVIIGIPNDKDYVGVVREMSTVANKVILTKSKNAHYVFTSEQVEVLGREGILTIWTNSVEEAIREAISYEDDVVILGTTSVVSEVKQYQANHL